jgi:hypothetical protein
MRTPASGVGNWNSSVTAPCATADVLDVGVQGLGDTVVVVLYTPSASGVGNWNSSVTGTGEI